MDKNYFAEAKKILDETYGIDVIDDVILGRKDRIICYADVSDTSNIELRVISGSFQLIKLEDKPTYNLNDIYELFNFENAYVEVAGRNTYKAYVEEHLFRFDIDEDITFPIKVNGVKIWIKVSSYPIEKIKHFCTFFITNVTNIMQNEEANYLKTHKDSLTGLFNKYTLDYHYGNRYQMPKLHILYCDLDNFKQVNDTDGHKAGDHTLIEFSNILKSFQTEYNKFYRIGGDEFVGMFFTDSKETKMIARKILEQTRLIKTPYTKIPLSVSIGVVKADMRDDVIRKADKALYMAKRKGKDQMHFDLERNLS